ncbi:MAG: hypothetical protein A2W19_02245 [Spirochaetes bacterium RBG_16_49_21]|nr:MAG: hypothetical protein A2W19_02245 [Spirochaetes bacterium RBG_16_49_21]
MTVPRHPDQLMLLGIEAAEKALHDMLSHNPQFGCEFLETVISVLDWNRVLETLKLASDSENVKPTDFARLEGKAELSTFFAELRDELKEEMKDD